MFSDPHTHTHTHTHAVCHGALYITHMIQTYTATSTFLNYSNLGLRTSSELENVGEKGGERGGEERGRGERETWVGGEPVEVE